MGLSYKQRNAVRILQDRTCYLVGTGDSVRVYDEQGLLEKLKQDKVIPEDVSCSDLQGSTRLHPCIGIIASQVRIIKKRK